MYQQKDFNKTINMPDKNLNDEITKKIENNEKKNLTQNNKKIKDLVMMKLLN